MGIKGGGGGKLEGVGRVCGDGVTIRWVGDKQGWGKKVGVSIQGGINRRWEGKKVGWG